MNLDERRFRGSQSSSCVCVWVRVCIVLKYSLETAEERATAEKREKPVIVLGH